jgi:hypothetical protein
MTRHEPMFSAALPDERAGFFDVDGPADALNLT